MNVFETQIDIALEALPGMEDDGSSRASTPTESILGSPPSKDIGRLRPTTHQSEGSALSRFTSSSQPISVLGAINSSSIMKRPITAQGDPLGSLDRMISDKSDNIASRVASIQQKVNHQAKGYTKLYRSFSLARICAEQRVRASAFLEYHHEWLGRCEYRRGWNA